LKAKFQEAMHQHLKGHAKRRSWDTVHRDEVKGHQVLGCMWVFTYKTDKHGMLQRCKAKLVVCGNQQKPDNLPTRATTLAATSFRTLMAVVAKFDLETIQLNAINAFVNADLNELMYMRTPPGFPVKNHVLRLNRALYGLRRSPLLWQKKLSRALATYGFTAIPQEPCVLIKGSMVAFYFVDNIMFCYRKSAQAEAKSAIKDLKTRFEITNLGEIKWFLGLHVLRDRQKRLLWLSQKAYAEKVAERFGLAGHTSRQPLTPIPAKELHPSAETPTTSFRNLFQKKVGSVLYAAMQTRPNITFAALRFARFNYCYNDNYITLIDGIIRYL
jgi:DNA-binding CsgD family transcriptional regulator